MELLEFIDHCSPYSGFYDVSLFPGCPALYTATNLFNSTGLTPEKMQTRPPATGLA